ncbi:RNA-binding protein pno1 [Onthophagus taurus]|uniref:RNA-binding protein pno1 n=1 Tax=Onthophagus taurus TaxID=166361 RepID=UPI0039BE24D5
MENNESNINIDVKAFNLTNNKRKAVGETPMEVEIHNGIEGKSKNRPSDSKKKRASGDKSETFRKIHVPAHRYTPLKENWLKIFKPITEHLHLEVKFNLKTRHVEIRTCEATEDIGNIQKAADFVKAFVYGFDVEDALALIRLDDLFVETFEIRDIKTLQGDHQSRAIGRLAGKGGRTKFTIENATKTRIVLADSRIHILGSYQNIQVARRSICNLVLGSQPSKVYGHLRNLSSKLSERI